MGKFKSKKVGFAQVSNSALRDENLSLKAKGLYSLIQSYITTPDFTLYKWYLKKICQEGETAFNSAWDELKDNGYLKQEREQGEKGRFGWVHELLDVKSPEQKDSDHTPENHPMDNPPHGKGGVYNNTECINTEYINTESQSVSQKKGKKEEKIIDQPIKNLSEEIKAKITDEIIIELRDKFSNKVVDYVLKHKLKKSTATTLGMFKKYLESCCINAIKDKEIENNKEIQNLKGLSDNVIEKKFTHEHPRADLDEAIKRKAEESMSAYS